jgi:hypothetical protein
VVSLSHAHSHAHLLLCSILPRAPYLPCSLENPSLQRTFGISPAFAAEHKGLSSVANFSAEDALAASRAQSELEEERADLDEDEEEEADDEQRGQGVSPGRASDGSFGTVNPLRAAAAPNEARPAYAAAGGTKISSIFDVLGGDDKHDIGLPNPYAAAAKK